MCGGVISAYCAAESIWMAKVQLLAGLEGDNHFPWWVGLMQGGKRPVHLAACDRLCGHSSIERTSYLAPNRLCTYSPKGDGSIRVGSSPTEVGEVLHAPDLGMRLSIQPRLESVGV